MTPEEMPPADSLEALPVLRLRRDEERRLGAGHLWVFSNEVDVAATPLTTFRAGQAVEVRSSRDKFIGYATVNPNSLICARLLSRDPGFRPGKSLFVHRLQVALALRQRYYPTPHYRLVHGEADGLPGCVIDRCDDALSLLHELDGILPSPGRASSPCGDHVKRGDLHMRQFE